MWISSTIVLFLVVSASAWSAANEAGHGFEQLGPGDAWYVLYQGSSPAGYVHTSISEAGADAQRGSIYELKNEVGVWVEGGDVAEINYFTTTEKIDTRLRLIGFHAESRIGGGRVTMTGTLDGETARVSIEENGDRTEKELKIPYGCISVNTLPFLLGEFDPDAGIERRICTVQYAIEDVSVGRIWVSPPVKMPALDGDGAQRLMYRLRAPEYRAVMITDLKGRVLEEVQPKLGIVTRRVENGSGSQWVSGWNSEHSTIVPANMVLVRPEELRRLEIELIWSGVAPEALSLESDMQKSVSVNSSDGWNSAVVKISRQAAFDDSDYMENSLVSDYGIAKNNKKPDNIKDIMTIACEMLEIATFSNSDGFDAYLASDELVRAEEPGIRAKALEVVDDERDASKQVELIAGWIYREVKPDPMSWVEVRTAPDVLRERRGADKHRALLLAAMLRSLGIPARLCLGKWYAFGTFVDHYWNEAYVRGEWRSVDPSYPGTELPPLIIKLADSPDTAGFGAVFPAIDATIHIEILDYLR